MTRQFLVTKFSCAKCGANLAVSYDVPKSAGKHENGEPTGALMVHQVIAVEPCDKCLEPARKIESAMRVLRGEA